MDFTIDKRDKYTLIKTNVEKLDGTVSPSLKSEFVMINAKGEKNIILDISSTRYCDSSGLSAILVANRLCRDAKGIFVVAGVQKTIMKLITISQLDSILNIIPTVNEAVDYIFMEELEKDIDNEK